MKLDLWDVSDVARFLGVSRTTIFRYYTTFKIPYYEIGRKIVRFDPEQVRAWREKRLVKNASDAARLADGRRRARA